MKGTAKDRCPQRPLSTKTAVHITHSVTDLGDDATYSCQEDGGKTNHP